MTPVEISTLCGFLAGGFLVGIVAGWLDQLTAYFKGKK